MRVLTSWSVKRWHNSAKLFAEYRICSPLHSRMNIAIRLNRSSQSVMDEFCNLAVSTWQPKRKHNFIAYFPTGKTIVCIIATRRVLKLILPQGRQVSVVEYQGFQERWIKCFQNYFLLKRLRHFYVNILLIQGNFLHLIDYEPVQITIIMKIIEH